MSRTKYANRTTTIRETSKYQLYQGFGLTADKYWVLRKAGVDITCAISTMMIEMQAKELEKLTDEEFNKACSQLSFS